MDSYSILVACEKLGADTIEVIERDPALADPMRGVVNTTDHNTVQCFLGNEELGVEDDCELSPEEFNHRLKVTVAIFE